MDGHLGRRAGGLRELHEAPVPAARDPLERREVLHGVGVAEEDDRRGRVPVAVHARRGAGRRLGHEAAVVVGARAVRVGVARRRAQRTGRLLDGRGPLKPRGAGRGVLGEGRRRRERGGEGEPQDHDEGRACGGGGERPPRGIRACTRERRSGSSIHRYVTSAGSSEAAGRRGAPRAGTGGTRPPGEDEHGPVPHVPSVGAAPEVLDGLAGEERRRRGQHGARAGGDEGAGAQHGDERGGARHHRVAVEGSPRRRPPPRSPDQAAAAAAPRRPRRRPASATARMAPTASSHARAGVEK